MDARGYTLIEVLIAFSLAILIIPVVYQTLGTLSSRVYYLDRVSREINYIQEYNNSIVGELINQSYSIRSFYFEIDSIRGNCEERSLESRFVLCPYKNFSPKNPQLEETVNGVSVLVFNSGFYLLIPK